MTDFNKLLSEQMKDPEFRKEYEALEPEFTIKRAMIDARKAKGLTQKELSNSDQSVYTDLLAAQCERASGYQGRNGRALLRGMDQIIAESERGESEMKSDTVVTQTLVTRTGAMQAFQALRAQAKDTGVSEMTLDEINEEIGKARSEEAE